jgi:hypothetical protein
MPIVVLVFIVVAIIVLVDIHAACAALPLPVAAAAVVMLVDITDGWIWFLFEGLLCGYGQFHLALKHVPELVLRARTVVGEHGAHEAPPTAEAGDTVGNVRDNQALIGGVSALASVVIVAAEQVPENAECCGVATSPPDEGGTPSYTGSISISPAQTRKQGKT